MASETDPQRSTKSPGVALLLSFIWTGVGQIYNGQVGKGFLLIVLYVISIALMFVMVGIITTPILWIYGMWDAYRTAKRVNQGS